MTGLQQPPPDPAGDRLADIVQRGDPEEWLCILQHEATRANNAEDSLRHWRSEAERLEAELDAAHAVITAARQDIAEGWRPGIELTDALAVYDHTHPAAE